MPRSIRAPKRYSSSYLEQSFAAPCDPEAGVGRSRISPLSLLPFFGGLTSPLPGYSIVSMSSIVRWARLRHAADCGLRVGAWYPVAAMSATEVRVYVRGQLVRVPRTLVEL